MRLNRTQIPQDGLADLAMSFTGEQACVVRIRFIAAVSAMAEQLHRRDLVVWQRMQEMIAQEAEPKVRASSRLH